MTEHYNLYDNDESIGLKDLTANSNFKKLSSHRNLTFQWILKFPDANWDYQALTHRYNFSKSWFYAYPDKPWDFTQFSSIYNLTLKDLIKIDNSEKIMDFREISKNENVDYNWLELFPNANWDLDALAVHPNFTTEWLNIIDSKKWNYARMSLNKKLSWLIVEKHIRENWDFRALSHNENLNIHWYLMFKNKDWDYQVLHNRFITTCYGAYDAKYFQQINNWVLNFPTDKLDYEALSDHKFLNLDWIEVHKSGDWNFAKMSYFRPCLKINGVEFIYKRWLIRYPDKAWDPSGLMEQPLFDLTWLLLLPNLDWDLKKIKYQISEILLEHIIKFPELLYQRKWLCYHPYISRNWLQYIPDTQDLYHQLSKNKKINCDWLLGKPEANWDFKSMSYKGKLTLEIFLQFQDKSWDYTELSKNPNMDIQIVKMYPDRAWVFCSLSHNYTIDLDVLLQFMDQDWNFSVLSTHQNLNFSWLQSFPDKPWCFTELSRNKSLSVDWLRTLPDKPWDFEKLSVNENLTLDWINAIPKAEWRGYLLSSHRNFRLDWYQSYPDGNWNFEILANRRCVKHLMVEFQKKCTYQPLLQTYWDKYKINRKIQTLLCLVLLNKDNFPYLSLVNQKNKLLSDAVEYGTHLSEEERQNVVEVHRQKIKIHTLYPEMFQNPSNPLLLTDLSGDSYEVMGWFQSQNLMRHIHETLPELGAIDIYIESFTDKPDQLGSQSYTKHLKFLLFNNPRGPQAMIVYPEL